MHGQPCQKSTFLEYFLVVGYFKTLVSILHNVISNVTLIAKCSNHLTHDHITRFSDWKHNATHCKPLANADY